MATLGASTPITDRFPRLIPGRYYNIVFEGGPSLPDSDPAGGPTYNWFFIQYVGDWWGFERRDNNARVVVNPERVQYVEVYRDALDGLDNFGNWG